MKIGLIDLDGHNFPNLALMKLSAWHKARGDTVEWWWGFGGYDRVYMSKVFDETYSPDIPEPLNSREIIKGGTGYVRRERDKTLWIYHNSKWTEVQTGAEMCRGEVIYQEFLPNETERIYPDYSLYPELTKDTAYGFLTRGCPRGCGFCIVAEKEGRASKKVADLSEWWNGQKRIELMDPNLLACREHMELLGQLADSGAYVDFNQGLDCRLLTKENIQAINSVKLKQIHFAWDCMREEAAVLRGLKLYAENATHKPSGAFATVYCLANYDTTMEENLYRIYTLRDMGYDPYIKEKAPTIDTGKAAVFRSGTDYLTGWDNQEKRVFSAKGVSPTLSGSDGGGGRSVCGYIYDARGNGDGEIACTLTGDHQSRVTDYTAIVMSTGQARAEVTCDITPTLNCNHEQPIVAAFGETGIGYWQNGVQTLRAEGENRPSRPSNVVVNVGEVRRLTPLECERLQGYPDGWTDIGPWTDSAGKLHKESSDSARYKVLGNSIALPPWSWALKRLCACYERTATMASLFDGIGGFPLIWERLNGPGSCLWASEIEEFPIAVTRWHFGGKDR